MPRQWSATRAYVRELDQVPSGTNFSYGGVQYLTNVVPGSAMWNRMLSGIGSGAVRFYPTQNWAQFLVPGRVLTVEQPVSGYSGFLVRTLTCFLIEEVEPATNGEIAVRGPGVESLLGRKAVWRPIGEERVMATTVAPQDLMAEVTSLAAGVPEGNQAATLNDASEADVNDIIRIRRGTVNNGDWHAATITNVNGAVVNFTPAMVGVAAAGNTVQLWPPGGTGAHAPVSTTVAIGAPHGMDAATLASVSGMVVGDEVRIRTGLNNDGPWFSGRITSIDPPGAPHPNTVQFVPDITQDAAVGNSVEVRAASLRVYDVTGFTEGQRIVIAMNGGGTKETVIVEASGDDLTVSFRDGLTAAASIGNAVTAYDYGARTTADVSQVMDNAPEWTVAFETGNGSAQGTSFTPKGESVFDILLSIAERTGEFFRYTLDASGIPTKRLDWRRTPDSSGVTLILYDSDEYARQRANELDATKGAAFSIRKTSAFPLVTRIYPSTGDQAITLASCSDEALLYAAVEGCTVHISEDFYEPDYIENAGAVANPKIGVHSLRETYGDISLDDAGNTEQLVAACDQLLFSAVQALLQAQLREFYTVEAYIPVAIKPGQTVKIENATAVTPTVSTAVDYIVIEVRERQVNGRSRTELVVSNMLGLRRTAMNVLGQTLRSTTQALRRLGSGTGSGTSVSVTGGVVGQHVHTEYLPIGGGVELVGDMPVYQGVTIDGVDISAHAANPDAHHASVTLLDQGLRLIGQAVGLRLSPQNPALTIKSAVGAEGLSLLLQSPSGLESTASGLALADGTAGEGLRMVGKVLGLDLASPSGLLITGDKLLLATAGGDLSAVTVNGLNATGHAHRIINTSDGQTSPSTLLRSGASGDLRLGGLSIGAAWTGSEALLVQPAYASQTAARLKGAVSQSAPLWRVENSAGQALLLATAAGDLESGNPGFVSGLTGWQISADGTAEFNNMFIRGELHATVFVADEMHATGGTLAVMTAAKVAAPVGANDNKMPATGAAFVLNVAGSWDTGLSYFAAGDVLRIKTMSRVGGGLDLYDIWLTVESVGALTGRDLANGNPGWFPTTVTRRYGGAVAVFIPAGSAVVKWGRTGQTAGSFTGGLILTSDLNLSPYIDIFTVPSDQTPATWANPQASAVLPTPRVRVGNLDGVLGLPVQWGMAAGTNLSDTSTAARYIIASNLQIRTNNVDQSIYKNGVEVIRLNSGADGSDPSIAVGHPSLPTGLTSGGAGFYTAQVAATAKTLLRVGQPTGPALRWDGTNLSLHNVTGDSVIRFEAGGGSFFAGPMTLAAAAGGIWQATAGTWSAPRGGFKLWNNGGVGTLTFYNDDGTQPLVLDRAGITLRNKTSFEPGGIGELTFVNGSGTRIGGVDTFYSGLNSLGTRLYSHRADGSAYSWLGLGPAQALLENEAEVKLLAGTGLGNSLAVRPTSIAIGGSANYTVDLYGAVTLQGGGALMIPTTSYPTVPTGRAAIYVYKNGSVNQLIFQSGGSLRAVVASLSYA